jgi:D-alanyl-D-alanine carboxypeptidase
MNHSAVKPKSTARGPQSAFPSAAGTGRRLRIFLVLAVCAADMTTIGCAETAVDEAALRRALKAVPADAAAGIRENRKRFDASLAALLAEDPALLVPVDKTRALPSDYVPPDLATLDGAGLSVSKKNQQLRKEALTQLKAMSNAAEREGTTLIVSSAYRSFAYQQTVYQRTVAELGQAAADRESARPGHSQHQLGTAVDFGSIDDSFAGSKAAKWLAANAGAFGFSLSFPANGEALTGYKYEPWHYRYITIPGARLQKDYFADSQYWLLAFLAEYSR